MSFHYNLAPVAQLIKTGLANVVGVGDSTMAPNASPRWGQGIRRVWPVKWIGKLIPWNSLAPDDVGIVFPNAGWSMADVESNANFADAATLNATPVIAGGMVCPAAYPQFNVFLRHVLTNMQDHGQDAPGGPSPYATNWANGKTLIARYMLIVPATPSTGMDYCQFITQTGGSDGAGVVDRPRTYSAGFRTLEQTCVAGNASTDEYEAHTRVFWAETAGVKHYQAGVLFYVSGETTGFQWNSLAVSGTSTTDHLSPLNSGGDAAYYDADGNYTQAQLTAYLTALRSPNIAMVQLGINRSTGEFGGDESHLLAHKAIVEKICLRYRAAMLAAGATDPKVLLVTHWQVSDNTSANITWANGKFAKYCELADSYDWISVVDLNGALIAEHGAFTAWNATYLSDTIHQTEAGVLEFARLLWNLFEESLAVGSIGGGFKGIISDG